MNLDSYRRRIARLEHRRNARAFARKLVFGRFVLWTDRLPEGTPIPEGARVVRDFYPFDEDKPGRRGCTSGYYRERITDIPGDDGIEYQTPVPLAGEPGEPVEG